MPILLILCYNGSLVTWPSLPPSLSFFYFLCLVSPCPMLRTRSFSCFCMTSACCLHFRYRLSGHPTAMSGLTTITYPGPPRVSTVIRHGFFTDPALGRHFRNDGQRVTVRPFPPTSIVSRRLATPSVRFSVVTWSSFRLSWRLGDSCVSLCGLSSRFQRR
jgi:hypothetical protein